MATPTPPPPPVPPPPPPPPAEVLHPEDFVDKGILFTSGSMPWVNGSALDDLAEIRALSQGTLASVVWETETIFYTKESDGLWRLKQTVADILQDGTTLIPYSEYHGSPPPANAEDVEFNVSLAKAAKGDVSDPNISAFSFLDDIQNRDRDHKISVRFGIEGFDEKDDRGQRFARRKNAPQSLTRSALAKLICECFEVHAAKLDYKLCIEGREISLHADNIVLVRVKWVTKGSIQPVLHFRDYCPS
ncbi:uncharacterized protein BXZ73DRAFT_106866 [Epithele typhae]|uniref:uncharacterized protein n=1 Tax=Epithele typhae TaxID=378194 RepID=UPI0020085E9D|nr:uncharacterized protein BXZ73DRAFT_106866 [Epithele typhae]KAH9913687.1 hypothetical protein BXZ73DRAFT_106866 [Epithele typhae]